MDIVYVELEEKDIKEILDLWQLTTNIYMHNSNENSYKEILRYLKSSPGLSIAALHDNKIIGVLLSGRESEEASIQHLFVHKDFRSIGIENGLLSIFLKKGGLDIQKNMHYWY